ncbi:hypothetical protein TMatcc_003963 [Talaromyces marneffei ATCC 18224]
MLYILSIPQLQSISIESIRTHRHAHKMVALPFFPICFQCGTDQNPCHCKVVGPTLGNMLASIDILWLHCNPDGERFTCVSGQVEWGDQ